METLATSLQDNVIFYEWQVEQKNKLFSSPLKSLFIQCNLTSFGHSYNLQMPYKCVRCYWEQLCDCAC